MQARCCVCCVQARVGEMLEPLAGEQEEGLAAGSLRGALVLEVGGCVREAFQQWPVCLSEMKGQLQRLMHADIYRQLAAVR